MRKYFYILITLLAVLSIGFVGCKNKPTAVAYFLEEAEEKMPGETLTTSGNITFNNVSPQNYVGKTFESTTRKNPNGTTFKYKITFENDNNAAQKTTLMKFSGFDKTGNDISKTYIVNGTTKYDAEKEQYAPYKFSGYESLYLIIYRTGYLYFNLKALIYKTCFKIKLL